MLILDVFLFIGQFLKFILESLDVNLALGIRTLLSFSGYLFAGGQVLLKPTVESHYRAARVLDAPEFELV